MSNRRYTTRLQKGGALLEEMRELIRTWDGDPRTLEAAIERNALARPTRARMRDVVIRAFIPRFVRSNPPGLWRPCATLENAGWSAAELLPLHYYATAAAEPVLWDFVTGPLGAKVERGERQVTTGDVVRFLASAPRERFSRGRPWSPTVATRVARGVLAALRDFGLLEGGSRKRVGSIYVPVRSFAFLACLRFALGTRGPRLLTDEAWKLFLFTPLVVERRLFEAHQLGLLRYEAAGSAVRVEFPTTDLEEYAHVLCR